jgi:hypothetical protein
MRLLEHFVESNRGAIRRYVSSNSERLKASDELWGYAGYALNVDDKIRDAEAWMSDWRTRKEPPTWVLWNYSNVLRRLGREAEAAEIHAYVIGTATGEMIHLHLMMSALDDLHAGDYAAAEEKFDQLNTNVFDEWDLFFFFLLREGLEIHRLAADGQHREAAEAGAALIANASSSNLWYKDKIRSKALRKSLKAASRDIPGIWFRIRMQITLLISQATF